MSSKTDISKASSGKQPAPLSSFLKTTAPRMGARGPVSKLAPHRDEIATLRGKGYTLSQITDYLRSVGVVTSQANLSRFLSTSAQVQAQKPN